MLLDLARCLTAPPVAANVVVIVGSGAAGIACAEALGNVRQPVMVIESGAAEGAGAAAELNAGVTVGQPYAGLTAGRSRELGGTTSLWHGQCMRLHPHDMAPRSWITGSGWPLGLPDLETHYDRAESWLQLTGHGYGAHRWDEHPQLRPVSWDPARLLHDFTEYTAKPMLGRTHHATLVSSPWITVLVNATAGRVVMSDHDAAVAGVQVFGPDGRSHLLPASRVVLAAGAIENARLLQLSDPGGVGLGTGRQHTGRFLQDHPVIRTAEVLSQDHRVLQDRYVALHKGRRRLFPKVRLSPEAQQQEHLVDATAVFVHDHQQLELAAARRIVLAARAHRAPNNLLEDLRVVLRAPGPVARDTYRRYVRGLATSARPTNVWLQIWLEQVPDSESRVTLGTERDRFGSLRAAVDWRVGNLEIETSRRMTRWIAHDLERLGLGQLRELEVMTDDDAWRRSVTDAFHPSGTTRMSEDPQGGVVDADLQVHGAPGLFVLGGSVFPVAGYANPTLTIVALAFRLADELTRRNAGRSTELTTPG